MSDGSATSALHHSPVSELGFATVRQFVLEQEAVNGFTESMILEAKGQRDKDNVVRAVAGLANADGGLVLVGVTETGIGDERLVGISSRARDDLLRNLENSLARDAMPDVLTVSLADGSGNLIVVLRVDADRVRHPVVVSGRVWIRMPGQTVPARREDIVALVRRGEETSSPSGHAWSSPLPLSPGNTPLFRDRSWHTLAVIAYVSAQLPHRALESRWLDPRAIEVVLAELRDSGVPDGLLAEHLRAHELPQFPNAWTLSERRSSWFRLECEQGSGRWLPHRPQLDAATYVQFAGRRLDVVLGVGATPPASPADREDRRWLDIRDLNELLLACVISATRTAMRLADALAASEPRTSVAQAFVRAADSQLSDHLVIPLWAVEPNRMSEYAFGSARIDNPEPGYARRLVRDWLTVLLLDLGADDFERELSEHRFPWLREDRSD